MAGPGIAIGHSRRVSNSSSSNNNNSGIQSSNTNMPNTDGTIQVDDEGVLAGRTVIVKTPDLFVFFT